MIFFHKNQFKIKQNKAYWNNSKINLSDKGHACLILFLESNQQVIKKEHLIKCLWNKVAVSDDSLFKVIQEVRKSLRQLGIQEDLIGNVYGKGYQWLKKEEPVNKKTLYLIPTSIIFFIVLGFIWKNSQPVVQLSHQEFQTLVQQLKKGDQTDLTTQLSESSHPLDQLRWAYLIGYKHYQSGNYDQSIETLEQGITLYGNDKTTKVLADGFLLLAKMYIYRDDKTTLKTYLSTALESYQALGDSEGVFDTKIEIARYHQAIYEYPESIDQLTDILNQARKTSNTKVQLRALANLAHSYEQTQQPEAAIKALEDTLDLALDISDGGYAAFAHGTLSTAALKNQNYQKAMKYAQAALQFSLSQHDTNQFQQSFSAFYLLLLPLGHIELADEYLDRAIAIQNHFNPEGVLYHAEIQRIESKIQQQKYSQSHDLLKNLMTEALDDIGQQETQALFAYNSHFLKDNINAYTSAKPVLENPKSTVKAKTYAAIAFILSAEQLERTNEAKDAFMQLKKIITVKDPITYTIYLDMLSRVPQAWVEQKELQDLKYAFDKQMSQIKYTTTPKSDLLYELNNYIHSIAKT